ncbi:MAG: GldM family protein [Ferruginibacter sp.]
MTYFLLSALLSISLFNATDQLATIQKQNITTVSNPDEGTKDADQRITFGDQPGPGKMSAAEFKYQQYCRAELENFDFDAKFSIISATVYFSGANFKNGVEKGMINSSSLKPIEALKARCVPGTMVVFDDIKVVGPDKEVRTIQGLSLLLY